MRDFKFGNLLTPYHTTYKYYHSLLVYCDDIFKNHYKKVILKLIMKKPRFQFTKFTAMTFSDISSIIFVNCQ